MEERRSQGISVGSRELDRIAAAYREQDRTAGAYRELDRTAGADREQDRTAGADREQSRTAGADREWERTTVRGLNRTTSIRVRQRPDRTSCSAVGQWIAAQLGLVVRSGWRSGPRVGESTR